MRYRRVDRVEFTDAEEIVAAHGETGGGKRGHIAQRLRQVEMLGGIGVALMEGGAGESTHAHHESGVLDFSRLVKQLRRDRAYLRVLQRLDQILNPIRL